MLTNLSDDVRRVGHMSVAVSGSSSYEGSYERGWVLVEMPQMCDLSGLTSRHQWIMNVFLFLTLLCSFLNAGVPHVVFNLFNPETGWSQVLVFRLFLSVVNQRSSWHPSGWVSIHFDLRIEDALFESYHGLWEFLVWFLDRSRFLCPLSFFSPLLFQELKLSSRGFRINICSEGLRNADLLLM